MKKSSHRSNLVTPLVIMLIGAVMIGVGMVWGNQTGYYHPDPAKRDANIGAGLVALQGFVMILAGAIVLVIQLVSRSRK